MFHLSVFTPEDMTHHTGVGGPSAYVLLLLVNE